jgi:hypothetical protein
MTRTLRYTGIGLMALAVSALAARAADKAKPVEGAWRQVEAKDGDARDYQKVREGVEMIDHIVGGRFVWTVVRDGKAVSVAGGRYKSEKDKFTEIIEYVGGQGVPESFVGQSFEFTVKVDGDKMTKVGTIQLNGAGLQDRREMGALQALA